MPGQDRDDTGSGLVVAIQRGAAAEIRRDVENLTEDVQRLELKVDDHDKRIGDLREGHAEIAGEVRHLVRAYERSATVATSQALTDLEIRKANQLAEIKERGAIARHQRAIRRELVFKAIAMAMGLWAILSAMLSRGC